MVQRGFACHGLSSSEFAIFLGSYTNLNSENLINGVETGLRVLGSNKAGIVFLSKVYVDLTLDLQDGQWQAEFQKFLNMLRFKICHNLLW